MPTPVDCARGHYRNAPLLTSPKPQMVLPTTNDPEPELPSPSAQYVHVLRNQAPGHLIQPSVTTLRQFTRHVTSEVTNQFDRLLLSRQRSLTPVLSLPVLHEHITKFESGTVALRLIITSPVESAASDCSRPSVSDSNSFGIAVDQHVPSNGATNHCLRNCGKPFSIGYSHLRAFISAPAACSSL